MLLKIARDNKLFFIILTGFHVLLLSISNRYITPELIFPVWVISNSNSFVSEITSFYPSLLFYLISSVNLFVDNLQLSFYITQLTFVIFIDVLLLIYLTNRFNIKFALIGFVFYIPWQVFFRGNYLWFDITTIPFIIISFIYFENFLKKLESQYFILASLSLSIGYFFKNTVLWIYILYLVWIIFLTITKQIKKKNFFVYSSLLIGTVILAMCINFIFLLSKSTTEFSFYWYVLMQNIIYPRMPVLSRAVETGYYLPLLIILTILLFSCLTIQKYANQKQISRLFLYSISFVSLINIYPRWGDFHLQLFLVFLTITVTYAITLNSYLTKIHKTLYISFLGFISILSLVIFANRIYVESNIDSNTHTNISKYAPADIISLIKGKKVFAYDFPLYNGVSTKINSEKKFNVYFRLIFNNPDKFYRITNSQIALNFVQAKKPDVIIIPYRVNERLLTNLSLTDFEKFILQSYSNTANIDKTYYFYSQKIPNIYQ